jgi:hypothetical protein
MSDADEKRPSARERKQLLREVDREAARLARTDTRHLRGVAAACGVGVVLFGGELVLLWKAGAFTDWSSASGSGCRGVGMIVAAQIALLGWIYRRFSRPSRR